MTIITSPSSFLQDNSQIIIAGTGHREYNYVPLTSKINQLIMGSLVTLLEEKQPNLVISGLADGFDYLLAIVALELGIPLESALPYPFESVKDHRRKNMLEGVLNKSVKTTVCSKEYNKYCFFVRDRYMVDQCTDLVSFYDGRKKGGTFYTVNYALNDAKKKPNYHNLYDAILGHGEL